MLSQKLQKLQKKKVQKIQKLQKKNRNKFYNKDVFIDTSNFLLSQNASTKIFISLIRRLKKYAPNRIIALADASLPYKRNIRAFIDEGIITLVPAGTEADCYLIQLANYYPNPVIITNDQFRDYSQSYLEEIEFARFLIVNSEILFDINLKSEKKIRKSIEIDHPIKRKNKFLKLEKPVKLEDSVKLEESTKIEIPSIENLDEKNDDDNENIEENEVNEEENKSLYSSIDEVLEQIFKQNGEFSLYSGQDLEK